MTEIQVMGPDKGTSNINEKEVIWLKQIVIRSDYIFENPLVFKM